MTKNRSTIWVGALLLILAWAPIQKVDLGTPSKEYEKADAIFLGTVLSDPRPWTRFILQRGYKGVDVGENIITGLSTDARVSDSCQYDFKKGEKYVVYARWWPVANELYAGACNQFGLFRKLMPMSNTLKQCWQRSP